MSTLKAERGVLKVVDEGRETVIGNLGPTEIRVERWCPTHERWESPQQACKESTDRPKINYREPQGAAATRCPECEYTYGSHADDCPRRILTDITNQCSVSTREAFITEHDPADVLKDALMRQRKVLGSLNIEWLKVHQVELVVDQLIAMYREARRDTLNAIAEIDRINARSCEQVEKLSKLSKLTEEYRGRLDALTAEGVRLKRTGQSLKRKLRSLERSQRRK